MLNFELLRIAIAVIFTGAAAWQDWKTSFIDDKIVLPMIAAGLLLDIATLDQSFIAYTGSIALLIAGIGYYAYRTGQLGGGDVLLFLGIHLLLPYAPLETANMLGFAKELTALPVVQAIPFFLVFLVMASAFALVGSSIIFARRLHQRGKLKVKGKEIMIAVLVALCITFLYFLYSIAQLNAAQIAIFTVLLACSAFTIVFKQDLMDSLIQKLKISQIEDEDILAIEKMPAKIVEKYKLGKVLTKQEVEKLKKIEKTEKIHSFPIYKELPRMGPYALVGLVVSIAVVNPIAYLLFL